MIPLDTDTVSEALLIGCMWMMIAVFNLIPMDETGITMPMAIVLAIVAVPFEIASLVALGLIGLVILNTAEQIFGDGENA